MATPVIPHPTFPVGSAVRVGPMPPSASPDKRRLAGRVGTVVQSTRGVILVSFPGEPYREHFLPGNLEPVAGEAA